MPLFGLISFLPRVVRYTAKGKGCFNALVRAYLISTLGFRIPHLERVSEGIFQSNCKYNSEMSIFWSHFLSLNTLFIFDCQGAGI